MDCALLALRFRVLVPLLAAACGGDDGVASPSVEDLCKANAALPCISSTLEECVETQTMWRDVFESASCMREWNVATQCVLDNPSRCEGGGSDAGMDRSAGHESNPICAPAYNDTLECFRDTPESCALQTDPCAHCICAACPCDLACRQARKGVRECRRPCGSPGNPDADACLEACRAAGPPEYQAYLACDQQIDCQEACARP
jgi:hypothetical protein